jgi:hypothetical protein
VRDATAGLCFGFAKRSVRFADSLCSITAAWPSRVLSHQKADCRRRRFGPAGPRLLRHRDPEPVGVCRSVLVESSPLHSGGRRMSERMKAPSASSRPPVSTGGSARMIRLFQACVNFFQCAGANSCPQSALDRSKGGLCPPQVEILSGAMRDILPL